MKLTLYFIRSEKGYYYGGFCSQKIKYGWFRDHWTEDTSEAYSTTQLRKAKQNCTRINRGMLIDCWLEEHVLTTDKMKEIRNW